MFRSLQGEWNGETHSSAVSVCSVVYRENGTVRPIRLRYVCVRSLQGEWNGETHSSAVSVCSVVYRENGTVRPIRLRKHEYL